jgi:hypothetical protein
MGDTCSVGLQQSTAELTDHLGSQYLGRMVRQGRLLLVQVCKMQPTCHVGIIAVEKSQGEQVDHPAAKEEPRFSLPFTHKLHTGLVQVNGFPQGLSPRPNFSQLTWQVLHQGQKFSSNIVSLENREGRF